MHIDNLSELQQTASFYGYWIGYKGSDRKNPSFISLNEVGSDIEIASWSGINTLERAIDWCTWLFAELQENEDRKNG